jgi:alkanesulfonate monooxygenase SsuD/methylene tetrahydromethanopterin reductase-like flavin-dependent oxidoreductase (luciferase family)
MTRKLKFQVLLIQDVTWLVLLERVRHVEALGFDLVAIADHFVDWRDPDPHPPWLEAWTLLAALARETHRIRLATYVSQIPLRHPALFARQALTLDHVSSGRLVIGLGTGIRTDPSLAMMGLPNWEPGERVDRFAEYVAIVDRLLTHDTSSFAGRYYLVQDAIMRPPPVQRPRPPLVIGALGPRMLALTARHADVWNSIARAEDLEVQLGETAGRMRTLDEACAAQGRDPATLGRSYVLLDKPRRDGRRPIPYYASPQAFIDIVARVAAIGINEIMLDYPRDEHERAVLERIAADVIPTL